MKIPFNLEIFGFLLSVVNLSAGFLLWHSATVRKDYAAKRDFEHLKRHYEQLAANQAQILTEIDRLQDVVSLDLRDIKNQVNVLIVKVLPDSTSRG